MTQITILKNSKGDFETHLTGCADIKRSHYGSYVGEKPSTYGIGRTESGTSLLAAIKDADAAMAAWFGEEAYTESSRENGCWTVRHSHFAPCFVKAVRVAKISWTDEYVPFVATTPDTGSGKCRGKWSQAGCKNGARSESWHLCDDCTTARKAAAK